MNAVLGPDYVDDLRELGVAAGLHQVGVASAEVFDEARSSIEARKAAGYDAGMQFTFRNPARSTDPRQALSAAQGPGRRRPGLPVDHRRIARPVPSAAWRALCGRRRVRPLASRARGDRRSSPRRRLASTRVLCDDNTLVDRAAAHRAGLGWYGKNANVLLPGHGSWFVLGSVVTDAPLPAAEQPVPDGCGSCTRCLDGCPTDAIVAPGVVDAAPVPGVAGAGRGRLPARSSASRSAIGSTGATTVRRSARRTGGSNETPIRFGPRVVDAWVDLVELLEADDADLLARHGRWYIPRRDPRYLRRNALVALGNVGDVADRRVVAVIERYLAVDDEMLRRHAAWAARQIGLDVVAAP